MPIASALSTRRFLGHAIHFRLLNQLKISIKMKKISVFIWMLFISYGVQSQQLFLEVFSGYNLTAYSPPEYNKSSGYVPIGVRLAGGFERIQIGGEYRQNITNPSFTFATGTTGTSEPNEKQEFVETYYGGLIRINTSSLPAYRFGLIIKGGAGFYNYSQQFTNLADNQLIDSETIDFDKVLGFNAGLGISAPIHSLLHWEIGYQFNFANHKEELTRKLDYKAYYHSFQMGLSLNLVFGNVAKKCRRVISSSR